MTSAWELAEEVVKAVNAGGGIVTGAYVREYIVRKGALDGRGKWSVGIEPPPVIRIWVSQENLEEVMSEIMSRHFFMRGTAAHGHEISLFDENDAAAASKRAVPNPMVEVSWRLFTDDIDIIRDGAYSLEIGSYDSEAIAFESDGLCISEGVIQQLEIRGANSVKEWNPYESMLNINRVCTDVLCGRVVCLPGADAFVSGTFGSFGSFGSGIGQAIVNEMVEARWTVTVGCVKKIPCGVDREHDGHCLICHEDLGAAHWQMECCQGRYHEDCLLVAFRQGPAAMATACKCLLCKMPLDYNDLRVAVHVLSGGKETVQAPMEAVDEEDEEEEEEEDDIGAIVSLLGGVDGYEEQPDALDRMFDDSVEAEAIEAEATVALVAAAHVATELALAQTEWADAEEEEEEEDEEEEDDNNACGLLDGSSENYVLPFNLTNLLSRREDLIRQQAGSLFGPFI